MFGPATRERAICESRCSDQRKPPRVTAAALAAILAAMAGR